MLDAYIIEKIKRREEEKRHQEQPAIPLPVNIEEDAPLADKDEVDKGPTVIIIDL